MPRGFLLVKVYPQITSYFISNKIITSGISFHILHLPPFHRDAPEATGDEAEDADLDEPRIYEKVSQLS